MTRSPDDRAPLDELLAQAGWMRALARSLVADPADAEDVVQDAWVVALRERAAVRVDVASWLRTIVRNLALRRRGRDAARPAIERRAARGEAAVEPGGAVERMELQRWLADALLALDEPYRSAVILRHVEGLDSAEIARRQGCSPAAARQRIARGLERLRAALDARPGGRRAWTLVLAPLAERASPPLSLTTATTRLVMGSKAVLGSIAALAAVALVWVAADRAGGGSTRGRTAERAEPVPALAGDASAPAEPADRADAPARESLATVAPARAAAPAAPDAPPSDPLLAWLSGRVLDTERAPLAGAEVVVHRPDASHLSVLDVEARRSPREVARGVTDETGRFAFELERGIPFDVTASTPEHGDQRLVQRYAGEELEIVLGAGFLVHGTITRERDGAPIADARVRVFRLGGVGHECETRTDARGGYQLRFAFDGAVLEVTPQVEMSSGWFHLTPGEDGSVRHDVALADGIEVRGRVVDAASGAPIAGARVGEGWTYRRAAETDARGEYVMRGFGTAGVQELYARAPGYGGVQLATLPAAVDGVMRADFALSRGRTVRGRVLDAERRPLAGAYVAAIASEDSAEGQRTDWISGRTDASGRFELAGLTRELRHALLAGADGHATAVYDFPADELELDDVVLEDVALAPPAVLAGTVRDESGAPMAGMEVVLRGANRDRGIWRVGSELGTSGDWYVDSREATTDAQGRFWFGALAEGDYGVRARRSGQPDGPAVQLALDAGQIVDDFVLLYPRGEELTGKVVDEQGRGLEGVYVNASQRAARGGASIEGRHASASVRTDASGAFAFRGLPPGTYRLDAHPFELEGDPQAPWLSTSLEAESGGEALEIELPRGATIRGRLVDRTGAALVGYSILARSATSGQTPTAATGDDGSFAIEVPAGTVWDLEVRGSWQTADWETVFHVEPGVTGPSVGVELRVDPTPARGD